MFSKNKKSRIFLSIIILFSIVMLTNAFFWQAFIIKQLNNQLSSNNYQIASANISGNLFYQIKVNNVRVTHPVYGNMSINKGFINIDFISSIFSRLTFDDIIVENLKTESLNNRLSKSGSMKSLSNSSLPFDVDYFHIDGQIPIEFQDTILVLIGEIEGKIKSQDNIKEIC